MQETMRSEQQIREVITKYGYQLDAPEGLNRVERYRLECFTAALEWVLGED